MAKVKLDELEVMIKLVLMYFPEYNNTSYEVLKQKVEEEFKTEVKYSDIVLLYEPTIEELLEDTKIHYSLIYGN